MKKTGKIVLLLLVQVLLLLPVHAAQVDVQATVDRNTMYSGDTFTLSVVVSSEGSANMREPRLPTLKSFDVLNAWPETQIKSQFINGKFTTSRVKRFNYMLAPKSHGALSLGAVSVDVNGQIYKTKPISITVKKGSSPKGNTARTKQRRQRFKDPFSNMEEEAVDVFNQLLRRQRPLRGQREMNINPNEVYFVDTKVDKKKVYVGEQVTVSWYIYTRYDLTNIQNIKYPDLKGFWKEDIEIATNLSFSNEVINGVMYKKALLASYALFPVKKGSSTIDVYKIKCRFRMPGLLGFRQTDYVVKGSPSINIKVLPLPSGQPKDFTGAVGDFRLKSSIEGLQVNADEPVNFKVQFSGRGNAKRIDLPELDLPKSVDIFDTKDSSKFNKNGTSFKNYEILLVPRVPGELILKPMSFSFFNPRTRKYYSQKTKEFKLKVSESKNKQMLPQSRVVTTPGEAELKANNGPPPIHMSWSSQAGLSPKLKFKFWIFALIMSFAYLAWRYMIEFQVLNTTQGIDVELKRRIGTLNDYASKDQWRKVGIEGSNLIYFLLGELSGAGGANRQADKLLEMAPPSVRRGAGEGILNQLKTFEEVAFAPLEVVGAKKDKKSLRIMIKSLDKICKSAVKLSKNDTHLGGE